MLFVAMLEGDVEIAYGRRRIGLRYEGHVSSRLLTCRRLRHYDFSRRESDALKHSRDFVMFLVPNDRYAQVTHQSFGGRMMSVFGKKHWDRRGAVPAPSVPGAGYQHQVAKHRGQRKLSYSAQQEQNSCGKENNRQVQYNVQHRFLHGCQHSRGWEA